ncbi:peptide-binding protein [Symbiobacterium thermophilum]|uniref:Solute-binding protein family 5 domain-containing protein n=1 Tax=Symbiobacterium thermophilum TaxID=2734 RepID=A0A953ICA1_SYMTR|nr:peptide-binding protein [Symbiobacterium thermophilum]MBY6277601.1 hypothetical protein [Symbiobacterium thermophilum]
MPGLKPVALTKTVVLTKPLAPIALVMLLTGCATPAYPWAGIRGAAGAAAGGPSSSGGAQTAEPMASSDEMPADGGTLYLSMFSAPRGVFNPILMEDGYDATIVGLVFAGLLTRDENLDLVCDLCESFAVSPDHRQFTFRLRRDVTWHDGHPFTAADVAFTFRTILHPDYPGVLTGEYAALRGVAAMLDDRAAVDRELAAGRITADEAAARKRASWQAWLDGEGREAIRVADDHTIVFAADRPHAPLLQNLAIPLLPAHVFAGTPPGDLGDHPATRMPVGTGPYQFVRYVPDQYVELVRHETYHRGRPHIERIIYRMVNQDVAIGQLKAGELDYVVLKPGDVALVADDPDIGIFVRPDLGYQYMGLNHRNPLFADRRVREAILLAIDRQAIVDHLLKGYGHVAEGHLPYGHPYHDPEATPVRRRDTVAAARLLAEAGWTERDAEGYLVRDGRRFRFTLLYPSGNAVRAATAPLIQADLKAVGIQVDLQMMEFSTLAATVFGGERPDAWLMGWGVGLDPDPGPVFDPDSRWGQATGWRSARSRMLLGMGAARLEPEARRPVYRAWSRLLADELPVIFLYSQDQIEAVRLDRVRGLRPDARGALWNVWELWIASGRR